MTKILVIEDEPLIRANTQEMLELEDFKTITAADGKTGLRLVSEDPPDLIICDIMMPEMDGYEVLRRLRQHPETATIPLIFLTAKAERQDMRQGMQLGADDYLTKPFTTAELLDAVNSRLQIRASINQQYSSKINRVERQLRYLTAHDSLTGLPNQYSLQQQFDRVQRQAARQGKLLSLLVMGLDRFNQIQSALGHVVGNSLLKAIAQRLTGHLGGIENSELERIAYLGGDRFAFLLQPIKDLSTAGKLADHVREALSHPFRLNNHELFITSSIGIAWSNSKVTDINSLLAQAEGAIEHAQKQGGNQYQLYNASMKAGSSRRLILEEQLHYALDAVEFQLYYQPQVYLRSGKMIGAEALLRWNNPEIGLISPAEFIPLAEETGLILPIGAWVLRTACLQAKAWQQMGMAPLTVAVNLSAQQLRHPQICQQIRDILTETDLPPDCLELEITEGTLIAEAEAAYHSMREIKDLGITIAIDDFGTGYSSLNTLLKYPFDTLKIDKSFVRNIANNPGNIAITTAIMQMAKRMDLGIVAEGIETASELAFLQKNHCDVGQGYLFAPPMTPAKIEHFYRR